MKTLEDFLIDLEAWSSTESPMYFEDSDAARRFPLEVIPKAARIIREMMKTIIYCKAAQMDLPVKISQILNEEE